MKIALVSPYDHSYPGGVAVHISNLRACLGRMGHQVKILAPCSSPPQDPGVIPVGRPIPVPSGGSIARITLSLTLSGKVKGILEAEKFDVVHIHEPLTPMLPLTVLRLSGALNIGTFHAYHSKPRGYGLSRLILRRWFRRLDGWIAVSEPARKFIARHFPADYEIIPNGVDLGHFYPQAPPVESLCDGKTNILFVGRLEKRKGLDYLLAAFAQVQQEFPHTRLVAVGPGTRLRGHYERLVEKMGLRNVVFAGQVPHEQLPCYYSAAHLFCAPATGEESFGLVLLEAMATGKPVVASAVGGYAQLIDQGKEGILVPPRSKMALAQGLLTLLRNPTLRQDMGNRGRLRAEEFRWEDIAQRVVAYYQKQLEAVRAAGRQR